MADWYWPGEDDVNDFPDPLGFEGEWTEWSGTMHDGPPVFAEIFSREFGYKAPLLMLEATSQAALHAIRGLERVPDSRVRLLSIQPDFGKDRPRLNEAHEDATNKIKAAAHETWSLQGKAMRAWVEGG